MNETSGQGAVPPPSSSQPVPPRQSGTDAFFDSLRRAGVVRTEQRWIGGVGGGIALRFGVDPLLARGLLLVSTLLGGVGLVIYGLGWLLLPEQRDGRIHLQELFRGHFDVAVLGAGALTLAGLSTGDAWTPFWFTGDRNGWWGGLVGLATAALVVVLVVSAARRREPGRPPTTTLYPGRGPGGPTWPGGPAGVPPTAGATGAPGPGAYPTASTTHTSGGTTMEGSDARPAAEAPDQVPAVTPADGTATETIPAGGYAPGPYPPGYGAGTGGYGAGTGGYGAGGPQDTPAQPYPGQGYPTAQYPAPGQAVPGVGHGYAPTYPGRADIPTTTMPRSKRGPGAGVLGIVVALTLLTLAGLLYAERVGTFTGPVALTTLSVAVILLGLAVLVSGLRGRTSGGLGALAVLVILAALPMSAAHNLDWDGTWDSGDTAFGDVRRTPTTVEDAEAGYSLGAGDARIDLTEVPLGTDEVRVPIRMGAGDLRIVVPADVAYAGEISVMAGEIHWPGDQVVSGVRSADEQVLFESDAVASGETAVLVLDVNVGAGNVTVVEEER